MNESRRNSCPLHIWKHEVCLAAIGKGADAELVRDAEINAMVLRWYEAGEPVWMAAESLAFLVKQREKLKRAEAEADYYKEMAKAYKETAEGRKL